MIRDYPKAIVTKDGVSVRLRPAVPEDEERLWRFFSDIPEEEQWFIRERFGDREFLSDWIHKVDNDRVMPIIAEKEEDGAIIGILIMYRSACPSIRHVVHLRIIVHPSFRSMRVGSWMILDSVQLSMDLGIEKVVAEFVAGIEDAAVSAARKMDFHQESVLKDYVKDINGKYRDLLVMTKTLMQGWSDF